MSVPLTLRGYKGLSVLPSTFPDAPYRHNGAMQEVFSRADDPSIPLRDQEFYELRLDDSDDIWRLGHVVMQSRATWGELDGQMMWDQIETERLATLEEAKERYAARRRVLAERGFVISDMDF